MITKKENLNSVVRCSSCKKKVLIPMNCMCNQQFCIKCRSPEIHACTFNYFAHSKEQLEKHNPLITPKKIDKI
jgi:predicted nucleic acid binding AN1-type Zn finger protein